MAASKRQGEFADEEAAFLYVRRHLVPLGVWTGTITREDGSADLLHNPDAGAAGPRDATKEQAAREVKA